MTMELKIEFGIDFELKRVKNTLAELDWYNSQGYKPRLPKGVSGKSSEKEIQNQIIKEFDEKKYKEVANQIALDFSTINKQLSKKLKESFNKDIPITFFVYLTNYGVGGSYNLPNLVIFNINNKKGCQKPPLTEGWHEFATLRVVFEHDQNSTSNSNHKSKTCGILTFKMAENNILGKEKAEELKKLLYKGKMSPQDALKKV